MVPILNLVWAGNYGLGRLPMWACHSSCGQLSFSLLRLYGHRVDGKRRWCPKCLRWGHGEALSGSRGFFLP